jgi:hypothetical protein
VIEAIIYMMDTPSDLFKDAVSTFIQGSLQMLSFALEHLLHPIEKWRHSSRFHQVEASLLIGLLFAAVSLLVYQQGGTQSVYPHLMYASILFAAFYFQVSGGLIAGILAGLAIGPFMPLNVAAEIPQPTLNWLIRTGFFVMVGLLAGLGSHTISQSKKYEI